MTHLLNPARPRFRLPQALLLTLGASLGSGCYTTTNTVTVTPLKTKYPVSASGQYVTSGGEVVTEDSYEVVESFKFDKQVEAPRHEDSEAPLALEAELDRLIAQHGGDAVTDLKIAATDYDAGSHGSAASWKVMGWTFGLSGGTFLLMGATSDTEGLSDILIPVGGVFLGIGALSFALSALADDPATWQLQVQGSVVKQKTGAPAAEPAAAPEAVLWLAPPAGVGIPTATQGSGTVALGVASAKLPPGYRALALR